jgi:hypothetical protein
MVMVDDATNRVWAQFVAAETTRASYEVFAGWVRRWGLPGGLYVDRDSIYRCEGLGSVAEQLVLLCYFLSGRLEDTGILT